MHELKTLLLIFSVVLIFTAIPSNGFIVTTEQPTGEQTAASEIIENESLEDLKQESIDWSTFANTLNTTKIKQTVGRGSSSSLQNVSFATLFYKFQQDSFLTDCIFIVGPDGQEEKIEAHSLVLAAASPLFNEAFHHYNSRTSRRAFIFRIGQISKTDFQNILHFIYSGDICIIKSDSALALFKYADLLGLDGMKDAARSKIMTLLDIDNVWQVYNVAKETKDRDLERTTNFFISQETSDILKRPGFIDISRDVILGLVSQDKLKIDSEYQLYEAIVRWAMHQAHTQKLEVTPEVLRKVIGADILKRVRFSTMSAAEFAQVYMGFKILTYEEILPIIFNINAPGSVALPDSLSQITRIRNETLEGDTFITTPINGLNLCNITDSAKKTANSAFLTKTPQIDVSNSFREYIRVNRVRFQKSFESMGNCNVTEEHFDFVVTNRRNDVVQRTSYDGIPGCSGNYFDVPVEETAIYDNYKIQVEFRASRQYKMNTVDNVRCVEVSYSEIDNGNYIYECKVERNGFISSLFYRK